MAERDSETRAVGQPLALSGHAGIRRSLFPESREINREFLENVARLGPFGAASGLVAKQIQKLTDSSLFHRNREFFSAEQGIRAPEQGIPDTNWLH
jgi:hypothetical protein